ncbi:MAG: hypothetical protein V4709_14560 [Pseudomonadota bacterium]
MFEQSPTVGPGMGTVTQHTAEIFLLLAGAFALGMLLSWLLSRGTAKLLRQTALELLRTKERLVAAERRPAPTARLRESNSTEHERTLNQLRESREAEARARERILELEGRVALMEAETQTSKLPPLPMDALESVLPFVTPPASPRKK